MAAGDGLVALLEGSTIVGRLRELATAIRNSDACMAAFADLLQLQKRLVKAEAKGETGLAARLRAEYDDALGGLAGTPAVAEYLDLIEELDDAVRDALGIINAGIAR